MKWGQFYGAGGGGMGPPSSFGPGPGKGGSGVGGIGGIIGQPGTSYSFGRSSAPPGNGKDGTGSGGGGAGGRGGSGIVIIRVDHAKLNLDAANAKIQSLEQQKASLQQQIAQRDARIKQLEAQGVTDSAEIQQLRAEKASLESQLATANAEIASLKQQLSQANQTIADQKQTIDAQKQQISSLQSDKQKLEAELAALKQSGQATQAQVALLTNQITSLNTQIQSLLKNVESMSVASMETIRATYEDRMTDLQDAKSRELAAIQENNQLKYNQALEDQNEAAKDVIDLKREYDFMVTDLRVIRAQLSASTAAIAQTESDIKALQQRLDVLTATPEPTQPSIQWGTSLYVIIDADAWMNDGIIVVMAMNGTEVVTEPFQYRSMRQVFVISSQGHLRCLDNTGYYVTAGDTCLVPRGTESPPEKNWSMRRVNDGHSSQYSIMSESCGSFMVPSVNQVTLERMPQTDGWFVIPVGRMQSPMVQTSAPRPITQPPTTAPPDMDATDIPINPPANPLDIQAYVGYELNTAKIYISARYPGVTVMDMDVTTFSTTRIQPQPNTVYLVWKNARVKDGDAIASKKIVQTVLGTIERVQETVRPVSDISLPTVTTPTPQMPQGAFDQYIGQSLTLVRQDIQQSYPGYTLREIQDGSPMTMDYNPQRITIAYVSDPTSSQDAIVTRVTIG